jgi:Asp-tRNA(Asn)/Glu-tRNA(Gln) amidotransferase A subunit family amidase
MSMPRSSGRSTAGAYAGRQHFNRDWTLLHVPCINIAVARGPNRTPTGLTLTGPRCTGRRVLAVAAAMAPLLNDGAEP